MHDRLAQEGAARQDTRIAVSIMEVHGGNLQDLLSANLGNNLEVHMVTSASSALHPLVEASACAAGHACWRCGLSHVALMAFGVPYFWI